VVLGGCPVFRNEPHPLTAFGGAPPQAGEQMSKSPLPHKVEEGLQSGGGECAGAWQAFVVECDRGHQPLVQESGSSRSFSHARA
jgi:hypothetical protein